MEQTSLQLDEDEERFHKLQLSDQANFDDRLDTLQVCVAVFGTGAGGVGSDVVHVCVYVCV